MGPLTPPKRVEEFPAVRGQPSSYSWYIEIRRFSLGDSTNNLLRLGVVRHEPVQNADRNVRGLRQNRDEDVRQPLQGQFALKALRLLSLHLCQLVGKDQFYGHGKKRRFWKERLLLLLFTRKCAARAKRNEKHSGSAVQGYKRGVFAKKKNKSVSTG